MTSKLDCCKAAGLNQFEFGRNSPFKLPCSVQNLYADLCLLWILDDKLSSHDQTSWCHVKEWMTKPAVACNLSLPYYALIGFCSLVDNANYNSLYTLHWELSITRSWISISNSCDLEVSRKYRST